VILLLTAVTVCAETPRLAGKWRLNAERSEDAKAKLEDALKSAGLVGQRTNAAGPNRDLRDSEREQLRRTIETLIEASQVLEITQDAKVVTIAEGNARERKFYTNGRPYQREDRRGNRMTIRARWQGERLSIETRLADGGRFTETFELAPGGQQLIATFTSADSRLKRPLVIQRIYDADTTPTD
jgi:hypothetical protein